MPSVLNYYSFVYFHNGSFSWCWNFFVFSLSLSRRTTWNTLPIVPRLPSSKPQPPYFHVISISLDGWIYTAIRLGAVSVLGLIQHSKQIITRAISARVIRPKREAEHSPSSGTSWWMCIAMPPISQSTFSHHSVFKRIQFHVCVTYVIFLLVIAALRSYHFDDTLWFSNVRNIQ